MTTQMMVDTSLLAALRDERSRQDERIKVAEDRIRAVLAERGEMPLLDLVPLVAAAVHADPSAVRLAVRRLVDSGELMVTLLGGVRTLPESN